MADIFISYSRDDRPRVEPLAEALVSAGYSVWWDRNLAGGSRYLNETEAELKAAKAVLVVWTKTSVASHWVADEAGAGRDTGRLLPISLDGTAPPLGFRQFQVIDFSHWKPGNEAQLTELRSALGRLIGSSGAMPPSAAPIARKPIPRRTLMIGGLVAAGVAVIAAVAMFAMGPQASQPTAAPATQRIAFFGFTTNSNDPAATATTEAATDQMFETMGLFKLEAAARDATLGTPPDKRLARAVELGARSALSGAVRPDTDGMTLSVRLVDVPSRTTLWERSFSGPASETAYLPAQAAWPTNDVMRCLVFSRSRLTRDTPQLMKLVADQCREGFYKGELLQMISRTRDLLRADPESVGYQTMLSALLAVSVSRAPESARPALIAEAEALLQRASARDPKEIDLVDTRLWIETAKAVPLAEFDRLTLDALAQIDATVGGGGAIAEQPVVENAYVVSQVAQIRAVHLQHVGRFRESLPHFSAAVANDPGAIHHRWGLGATYAVLGQSSRARTELESAFATDASAGSWIVLAYSAIFDGAGDAEAMLKSPPSFVPRSTVDCFRDIQKAYVSKDPKARNLGAKRASACADAGDLDVSLSALAALGDLDAAFAQADKLGRLDASSILGLPTMGLFSRNSRAMRADPRFLPLVEKLGLMEYWRATKSQPDACETEDVPFCRELNAAKP